MMLKIQCNCMHKVLKIQGYYLHEVIKIQICLILAYPEISTSFL